MAITQTGSVLTFTPLSVANTGTVSSTITVPSDADFVVVGVSGFKAEATYFSGGGMTFTKGGVDTAMTAVGGADGNTSAFMAAMFYLALPDTGTNKTLKWDWQGTGTAANAPTFSVTFWKGVDTSSPVRNSQGAQSATTPPYTTGTITAVSGDLIIAWVGGFDNGTQGTIDSWSNLTLLSQITGTLTPHDADGAWATGSPSGNTTVAASTGTSFFDGGIVAMSVKAAATSGFGILITNGTGTLTGAAIGATNAISINGGTGVAVAVGDLIVAVIGENGALTATGTTDNLGNTYTAQNAGSGVSPGGRMFYSLVSVAGTLTTVTIAATASANPFACCAAAFTGVFSNPPIDKNPANITDDTATPYTCPATGTLTQASELIIAWGVHNANAAWSASSPNVSAVSADRASADAIIGSQVVSATTTVSPAFTGTAPTKDTLGTASFMAAAITPSYLGMFSALFESAPAFVLNFRAVPYR